MTSTNETVAMTAVFEARHGDGRTWREIAEWSQGQPWGPVSRGEAERLHRKGLDAWHAARQGQHDEAYAGLRASLDELAVETRSAYEQGKIDITTYVETSLKIATRLGALLSPPVSQRAVAAIDEMAARRVR